MRTLFMPAFREIDVSGEARLTMLSNSSRGLNTFFTELFAIRRWALLQPHEGLTSHAVSMHDEFYSASCRLPKKSLEFTTLEADVSVPDAACIYA